MAQGISKQMKEMIARFFADRGQPMRIAFVSQGVGAHLRPHVEPAREIQQQGHEVRVFAPAKLQELAEDVYDLPFTEAGPNWFAQGTVGPDTAAVLLDEGNVEFNRKAFQELAGSTKEMVQPLKAAIEEWGADLIISEDSALAATVAGDLLGIPVIYSENGLMREVHDFWEEVMREPYNEARIAAGLEPVLAGEIPVPLQRIIVPTIPELLHRGIDTGTYAAFQHRSPAVRKGRVVPNIAKQAREALGRTSVWEDETKTPVYMMYGQTGTTISEWREIFKPSIENSIEAVGRHPEWEGLIAVGKDNVHLYADIGDLKPEEINGRVAYPAKGVDNVWIIGEVNQPGVLEYVAEHDGMGGNHAGFGSAREILEKELPTLFAPNQTDQPGNAKQLAANNLGVMVEYPRDSTVDDFEQAFLDLYRRREEIRSNMHALNEQIAQQPTLEQLVERITEAFVLASQMEDIPLKDAFEQQFDRLTAEWNGPAEGTLDGPKGPGDNLDGPDDPAGGAVGVPNPDGPNTPPDGGPGDAAPLTDLTDEELVQLDPDILTPLRVEDDGTESGSGSDDGGASASAESGDTSEASAESGDHGASTSESGDGGASESAESGDTGASESADGGGASASQPEASEASETSASADTAESAAQPESSDGGGASASQQSESTATAESGDTGEASAESGDHGASGSAQSDGGDASASQPEASEASETSADTAESAAQPESSDGGDASASQQSEATASAESGDTSEASAESGDHGASGSAQSDGGDASASQRAESGDTGASESADGGDASAPQPEATESSETSVDTAESAAQPESSDSGDASASQQADSSDTADASASESSEGAKEAADSASESSDTASSAESTDTVKDATEDVTADRGPGDAAIADPGDAAIAEPAESGPAKEPTESGKPVEVGPADMTDLVVNTPDGFDRPVYANDPVLGPDGSNPLGIEPEDFEGSPELYQEALLRALDGEDRYLPDHEILPSWLSYTSLGSNWDDLYTDPAEQPGGDGPAKSSVDDTPAEQPGGATTAESPVDDGPAQRPAAETSAEQGPADDGPAKSPVDDGPTDEVAEEPAESPSEQPGDDPTADGPADDGPAGDEDEGPAAAPAPEPDPTTGPDSSGPGEAAVPEPSQDGPASSVEDEEPVEIAQPGEQDGPGDDAVESDSLIDLLFIPEVPVLINRYEVTVHLPEEPTEEPASPVSDDAPTQELEVIVDLFGGTVEESPGAMKMLPEDEEFDDVTELPPAPRQPWDDFPSLGDDRW